MQLSEPPQEGSGGGVKHRGDTRTVVATFSTPVDGFAPEGVTVRSDCVDCPKRGRMCCCYATCFAPLRVTGVVPDVVWSSGRSRRTFRALNKLPPASPGGQRHGGGRPRARSGRERNVNRRSLHHRPAARQALSLVAGALRSARAGAAGRLQRPRRAAEPRLQPARAAARRQAQGVAVEVRAGGRAVAGPQGQAIWQGERKKD